MIFVLRSRIKLDVSLGLQRPFSSRLVGDEEVKVRPALHLLPNADRTWEIARQKATIPSQPADRLGINCLPAVTRLPVGGCLSVVVAERCASVQTLSVGLIRRNNTKILEATRASIRFREPRSPVGLRFLLIPSTCRRDR